MRFTLLIVAALSLCAGSAEAQLTGYWTDDLGGKYRVRQQGDRVCWFMDGSPESLNVFCGTLVAGTIRGDWVDVPGARTSSSGQITLRVENNDRIIKVASSGYDASILTRDGSASTLPTESGRGGVPAGARTITWKTNGHELGMSSAGQTIVVYCPPGTPDITFGSDVYTGDSSVCTAAAHAGLLSRTSGGSAVVTWRERHEGFASTTRNGITTSPWPGEYGATFSVSSTLGDQPNGFTLPGSNLTPPTTSTSTVEAVAPPRSVSWKTRGTELGMTEVGQRVTVVCPKLGDPDIAFGTDVYMGDSSICTAAAHVGVITREAGGTVTVEWRGPGNDFPSTTRNGITTSPWLASYSTSFSIVN
jgi:phosphatidylserine decarboxylase